MFRYGLTAISLLLLVGFLWTDSRRDAERDRVLREDIDASSTKTERLGRIETRLAAIDLRVRELESRDGDWRADADLEQAPTSIPAPEPPVVDQTVDRPDEAGAAFRENIEAAQEAADKAAERAAARTALFSAMDTESEAFVRMSEVQANAQIDMVYADMFAELALPPETAAAVRRVLVEATLDEMRAGIASMRAGEAPNADELSAAQDAREEQVRRDLSSILTPEEFTRWEQYADTKPARMLASNYDMQLSSLAPGLSLEDRQLARDVLVEETLFLQGDGADPFAGFSDPETSIETQAQILDNAANRLATVFDAEQMERFQAFAEYQLSMMESATRFMQ